MDSQESKIAQLEQRIVVLERKLKEIQLQSEQEWAISNVERDFNESCIGELKYQRDKEIKKNVRLEKELKEANRVIEGLRGTVSPFDT
jgi:hypothetical protein